MCVYLCTFTEFRVSTREALQHDVEGSNEEVMSELDHRQPQQMPQEEPGQDTLTESLLCGEGNAQHNKMIDR